MKNEEFLAKFISPETPGQFISTQLSRSQLYYLYQTHIPLAGCLVQYSNNNPVAVRSFTNLANQYNVAAPNIPDGIEPALVNSLIKIKFQKVTSNLLMKKWAINARINGAMGYYYDCHEFLKKYPYETVGSIADKLTVIYDLQNSSPKHYDQQTDIARVFFSDPETNLITLSSKNHKLISAKQELISQPGSSIAQHIKSITKNPPEPVTGEKRPAAAMTRREEKTEEPASKQARTAIGSEAHGSVLSGFFTFGELVYGPEGVSWINQASAKSMSDTEAKVQIKVLRNQLIELLLTPPKLFKLERKLERSNNFFTLPVKDKIITKFDELIKACEDEIKNRNPKTPDLEELKNKIINERDQYVQSQATTSAIPVMFFA
ncbi:hypothetical protein ACFORL_03615 [Legionella dresdenensis]|uniref:Dot/Icm T4SS effector n=1 Tax=Legionella dresdenensis TaxID=450200 RepID=A0ABV8CDW5_9GAMM